MISVTKYFLALATTSWNLFFSSVLSDMPKINCWLSTNLILAGHTFDCETNLISRNTIIHEFCSNFEIVENDWFIYSTFWNRSELDGNFCNDPEISFMTQDEFVDVRSWTDSWRLLLSLESADWCGNFDTNNDIVDVAVSVLFHAWSSGTDPASQGWELNWIWFMTTAYSELWKFLFHIFANDSSLNAGHHVVFINPFNFIHSCAVDWDNGPFFALLTHETFGYVCSSALEIKFTLQKESRRRYVTWLWRLSIQLVRDQ